MCPQRTKAGWEGDRWKIQRGLRGWPQRVPNLHKLGGTFPHTGADIRSPGPESHHVKPGAKKARQERRWGTPAEPDPPRERGEEPGINSSR